MNKSVLFTLFLTILGNTSHIPAQAQDDLVYVTVPPCRIVDTRNVGGVITANDFRNFRVSGTMGELAVQGGGTDCLDPKAGSGQKPLAISAYVIAVPTGESTGGVLTAYPSDQQPPPVGAGSTVNFAAGQAIGNTTNITLCDPAGSCPADGEFAVLARGTDQHVVIDVQGYFYPMQPGAIYLKSNGQNIGIALSIDLLQGISNKDYVFALDNKGQLASSSLYYSANNCTGTAYAMDVDYHRFGGLGAVFGSFLGIVYIPKDSQSILFSPGSELNSIGGCFVYNDPIRLIPVVLNDPSVTGVQNSYEPPITIGR